MMPNEIELLSYSDVQGEDKLRIFKTLGIKGELTDVDKIVNSIYDKYPTAYYLSTCWYDADQDDNLNVYRVENGKVYDSSNSEKCPTGYRYKMKYNGNIPQNKGAKITYESGIPVTEYGYNLGSICSPQKQEELDKFLKSNPISIGHYTLDCSDSTTEEFDPIYAPCYLYNKQIYARIKVPRKAEGKVKGINLAEKDLVWVKVEPMKWYVNEDTDEIISKYIYNCQTLYNAYTVSFLQGLFNKNYYDNTFAKTFIDTYVAKEIFQFNELFKEQTDNDNSTREFGEMAANQQSENTVENIENSRIKDLVNQYRKLVSEGITSSNIDDYLDLIEEILTTLEKLNGLDNETSEKIRKLLEPIKQLNSPENRLLSIAKSGKNTKFFDDTVNVNNVRKILPKTNGIIDIISQNYRLSEIRQVASIKNSEGNTFEQFIQAANDYYSNLNQVRDRDSIDEVSYDYYDSVQRLLEIIAVLSGNKEKVKNTFDEKTIPISEALDINNRISNLIDCADSDIDSFFENEGICFSETAIDIDQQFMSQSIDVVCDTFEEIDYSRIKRTPNDTSKEGFFQLPKISDILGQFVNGGMTSHNKKTDRKIDDSDTGPGGGNR